MRKENMQEHEFWDKQRIKLEKELVDTALNLCSHMGGAGGARIPIPGTTPTVYVYIGEMK